ncbi:MAG: Gfo/Idh/MocA family oxidoreductase [Bacteroidales bacterium]|nr:Gfo/Idh/MocA family oxidoreductase [Bacteroidales bacterium]
MIRFAVVGLGHIGKRHVALIRQIADAELVAVCDVLPSELVGFSDSSIPYFHSIDEMLASDLRIDVVIVCTPNGYHTTHTLKALKKQCHVVVEKPLALSSHDAELIVETSRHVSRNVFCVLQNRYSQPSVWLKQIVTEKRLGTIYMVQLNCFWNRDERYYKKENWHGSSDFDGGTLFTQFSHFVDCMYWLFGDITNIRGNFHDFSHQLLTDFEDSGVVTFDFERGGMGSLNYSTSVWDSNLESSITIIGENGSVKVSGQYMDSIEYCHIKDYELPDLAVSNNPSTAENHLCFLQNVVSQLQTKEAITTNLSEAVKVVDIIERIYQVRDAQWRKAKK